MRVNPSKSLGIMPNWCSNDLIVKGPPKEIDKFLIFIGLLSEDKQVDLDDIDDEFGDKEIDFNKIIPAPDGYLRNPGFTEKGFSWCVDHWGTKWSPGKVQLETKDLTHKKRRALLRFDTAWSPPEPIIKKLSEMFPVLNFELLYWECGAGYKGKLICRQGNVITEENSAYRGSRGG